MTSVNFLRIMFGHQWDEAAPLIPYFCLAGAIGAISSLIPTAMLAVGRPNLVAMADLVIQPFKAVVLTLIIYHYRALEPFAIGFLVITILALPYFYAIKQRCMPSDFRAIGANLARSALLTFLTLLPPFMLAQVAGGTQASLSYAVFFVCAVATAAAWLLSLWRMNHILYQEAMPVVRAKFGGRPPP